MGLGFVGAVERRERLQLQDDFVIDDDVSFVVDHEHVFVGDGKALLGLEWDAAQGQFVFEGSVVDGLEKAGPRTPCTREAWQRRRCCRSVPCRESRSCYFCHELWDIQLCWTRMGANPSSLFFVVIREVLTRWVRVAENPTQFQRPTRLTLSDPLRDSARFYSYQCQARSSTEPRICAIFCTVSRNVR